MAGGRTYRERALVLDKTKLHETDLIYTLLAENGRQVRAVGKGARKPGSRLAARCEVVERSGRARRALAAFSPTPVSDGGNYQALTGA